MHEEIKIKKILVPIDGSTYSMRAARYAIEIAKLQNAQILVIHIISKIPYGIEYAGRSFVDQYYEDIENQANVWFDKIIKMAKDRGIGNIKTNVFSDMESISHSIISYAQSNAVDLIVIGTKGKTGIQKFLLGSVAIKVSQHALCPVFLVR